MTNQLKSLVGTLILLVVAVAILWVYFTFAPEQSAGKQKLANIIPPELIDAKRAGDYEQAVAMYENFEGAGSSVERQAFGAYAVLGAKYRATGDVSAQLEDIARLKAGIAASGELRLWPRIKMLNALASQYAASIRDERVFNEIFKDEPYRSYLVPGDPDASIFNLFEWSYSLYPSSLAAIHMARWYATQYDLVLSESPERAREFTLKAEEYLKLADAAAADEMVSETNFANSSRYIAYRFWRSVVFDRLATQLGGTYQVQYPSVYTEFITFTQNAQNAMAQEYIQFARLYFADKLAADSKENEAIVQLTQLAGEMRAITNLDTHTFLKLLRHADVDPETVAARMIKRMYALSPEFKAAAEEVLAR